MKFNQNLDDGSCEIIFSEEEKKIIAKNGKIFFPAVTFKHFTNSFIKMVADWNLYFKDDVKNLTTFNDTQVEGEEPKDDRSN